VDTVSEQSHIFERPEPPTSGFVFILRASWSTIPLWAKPGQRRPYQNAGTVDVAAENPGQVSEVFCRVKVFFHAVFFPGADSESMTKQTLLCPLR